MEQYDVKLLSVAYQNLDEIYTYVTNQLYAPIAAQNLLTKLEEAILNLSFFPYKGTLRKTGAYANKGYRQLFVKNFIIVYRIDASHKQVIVVNIQYSKRSF